MRNVKTKVNVYVYLTLLMTILTSGHAQQITWTATIKPGSCVICSDEVVDFAMEDEIFELDELPIGEYIERSETEYRWFVDGKLVSNSDTLQVLTGNGTNLSPGAHTIYLEGSTSYCRVWHENGQKQQTNSVTVNWRSLASTSVQVSTAKAGEWNQWQDTNISVSANALSEINNKLNTIITLLHIPVISGLNINNVSFTNRLRKRDCCYEGETIINGEEERISSSNHSYTLSTALVSDFTGIMTTGTISGDIFGVEGSFEWECDIMLRLNSSVNIEIGKKISQCNENRNCIYGSVTQNNVYIYEPTIKIKGCINIANYNCNPDFIYNAQQLSISLVVNLSKTCEGTWKYSAHSDGGSIDISYLGGIIPLNIGTFYIPSFNIIDIELN